MIGDPLPSPVLSSGAREPHWTAAMRAVPVGEEGRMRRDRATGQLRVAGPPHGGRWGNCLQLFL